MLGIVHTIADLAKQLPVTVCIPGRTEPTSWHTHQWILCSMVDKSDQDEWMLAQLHVLHAGESPASCAAAGFHEYLTCVTCSVPTRLISTFFLNSSMGWCMRGP